MPYEACTAGELIKFLEELDDDALVWIDPDGLTLRSFYRDLSKTIHQKHYEIGSEPDENRVYLFSNIQVIGSDDFPTCSNCGKRLEPNMQDDAPDKLLVVDEDVDGPIHAGHCDHHGTTLFQFSPKD